MNESAKTELLLALFNGNQKTSISNSVNKDHEDNPRTLIKKKVVQAPRIIESSLEVKIEVVRLVNSFFF